MQYKLCTDVHVMHIAKDNCETNYFNERQCMVMMSAMLGDLYDFMECMRKHICRKQLIHGNKQHKDIQLQRFEEYANR